MGYEDGLYTVVVGGIVVVIGLNLEGAILRRDGRDLRQAHPSGFCTGVCPTGQTVDAQVRSTKGVLPGITTLTTSSSTA